MLFGHISSVTTVFAGGSSGLLSRRLQVRVLPGVFRFSPFLAVSCRIGGVFGPQVHDGQCHRRTASHKLAAGFWSHIGRIRTRRCRGEPGARRSRVPVHRDGEGDERIAGIGLHKISLPEFPGVLEPLGVMVDDGDLARQRLARLPESPLRLPVSPQPMLWEEAA